ncbi:MAG: Clp1/GlmU family protein [Archaeoglobaceae archaeon]|nr:Clp1/GlmU family protein [Archaeoglobaceae archaeon]MCX8151663.1 Clp1/GlmU family protein [Archaeoglobaceae archaeon]MDW8013059.1 Clp1/GlmU family protein [Archaeoglobaceae archaeon]
MIVEKGKTIVAKGKIKIAGNAEVLGAKRFDFEVEKFVPIYCIEDCDVVVDGEYMTLEGNTIPESWEKLAKIDWDTIFLYGGIDKGKSTLATFLANRVGGAFVVDLDIGQSDIAHPGAMGYGYAKNVVTLSEVKMENGIFVGCTSPSYREVKCLKAVTKIWKEVSKLEGKKIVDTTGWIKGRRAKDYKLAKLEIINPDIVVSFEGKPDFLENYEVFEVENKLVIPRSREQRAAIRARNYNKWLKGSKRIKIDFSLPGKEIPKDFLSDVLGKDIEFVRKGEDFLLICLKNEEDFDPVIVRGIKELYEVDEVCFLSKNDLKGIVVGLYKNKKYLGIGLLSLENDQWILETPLNDFDKIELGEIRFDGEREYVIRLPV